MNDIDSSQRLRENIRILVRKLGLLEKGEAICSGLTLTQCHVIVEIGRKTHMSVNELAELLDLDKSTVSRVVEQLVNNNLLLRETHTKDRRFVTLDLTPDGKELFQSTEQRMEGYYAGVLDCLPESKRQQVIESLELLSDALQENAVK